MSRTEADVGWAHAGEMCGPRCGKRSDLQWGPQWFASSLGACS
jgi:hypothetical protein